MNRLTLFKKADLKSVAIFLIGLAVLIALLFYFRK
jgi:hypothetical protein